jgi:hypothetical protein
MPFTKPEYDDDIEMAPAKTGVAAFVPFDPPPRREVQHGRAAAARPAGARGRRGAPAGALADLPLPMLAHAR